MDKESTHIFLNEQFLTEIVYTIEEMPTIKEWFELAYPNESYRQEVIHNWTEQVTEAKEKHKDSAIFQAKIRLKNGNYCWYEIKGTLWQEYHAIAFINIDRLVQQKEELIIQNNNKDKMLSLLTHDIRTPITQIISLLDLFRDKDIEADEFLYLSDSLYTRTNDLLNFVDKTLDWVKINFKQLSIVKSNILIDYQIDNIINLYAHSAQSKNIKIIKDNIQIESIDTDKDIFHIVLRNILANAIKFTPKNGKIKLEVLQEKSYCVIQISDIGIGISEEVIEKLKNKIHHTTKGISNEHGIGLGLLFSRDLLEKIGGHLIIDSKINQGTTVKIYIPHLD